MPMFSVDRLLYLAWIMITVQILQILIVVVFSKHPSTFTEGDCARPSLPFTSKSDAQYHATIVRKCIWDYWRCDSQYKGIKGFHELWGSEGYLINDSSKIQFDKNPLNGFNSFRAKSIVSKNLICQTTLTDPTPRIIEWSSYHFIYNYQSQIRLDIPAISHKSMNITSFSNISYFENGVIKYWAPNSSSSVYGKVIQNIMGLTSAILDIENLDKISDEGGMIFEIIIWI
eukprot:181316_1